MVDIERRHLMTIEECKEQIKKTKSPYRKKDLKKCLERLKKEKRKNEKII